MTKEEYKNLIDSMVAKPDEIAVTAKTLYDEIGKDVEQVESLKTANAEQEKRIRDLQDTNMKLFLSQTGAPPAEEDGKEVSIEDFARKLVSEDKEEI